MSEDVTTYESISLPGVTVTRTTSPTTGRKTFTAVVTLLEIDPTRTTTAEERVAGITSLDPPTVSASGTNALLRTAVRAVCAAYDATEGFTLDGTVLANVSHRVSQSILQALRKLDEDV